MSFHWLVLIATMILNSYRRQKNALLILEENGLIQLFNDQQMTRDSVFLALYSYLSLLFPNFSV